MPTIYDLAKATGFSPATVSKAFNGYAEVSQKTKDKILKMADEIGYVPNLTAQSLKTNRSYLVGVIFSEDAGIGLDHQFFSIVLESFRKEIGLFGYDTIFINKSLGNKEIGYLDHCKYRNVDGVVIITAEPGDMDVTKLLASNIKCVTTDTAYENVPYVTSDNIGGGRMAVKYLYEMGHRRIAHLAGPIVTWSAGERLVGYMTGLMEVGLPFVESYLGESVLFDYDEAYGATLKMFGQYTDETRPTAVFVSADIMTLAVIRALKSLGLRVPEDVSIIGFDDIALAKHVTPALTTIKQDKERIGKKLAEILFELIKGEVLVMDIPRLPVEVIERESVIKRTMAED